MASRSCVDRPRTISSTTDGSIADPPAATLRADARSSAASATRTNAVDEWSDGLEAPGLVIVGADALWVPLLFEENPRSDEDDVTVVRIEPETGDVTASIATGGALATSFGMTATAHGIWVRGPDPILVRIDPATNEVVDRIDARGGPGDVAVAFGSIWVTTERGEVLRLEP